MRFPFGLLFLAILLSPAVYSQTQTVFSGSPSIKISEGGIERTPEKVSLKDAANLKCLISKIGDKYYWTSRENKQLLRTDGGAFITFVSPDGAGYVRIIKPDSKDSASLMSNTESQFDYVEHVLIGLKTVTYYGKKSQ